MITLFNTDLDIDSNAFNTLPIQAQEYIKNILTFKYATVEGWAWCHINWKFEPKLHCVELCSIGSPARDIGVTWVYNTVSKQYEEYLTQYHSPGSVINLLNSSLSFDIFLLNLKQLTFNYFEGFLLNI